MTKPGGAVVPLITPITSDGDIDYGALGGLIEFQIRGGVEGLLILGTTGEGPSVPRSLRRALVEHVVKVVAGRIRVYVNVSENSLADSIVEMRNCFDAGADVVAALSPFYFPPRSEELAAWFRALLDAAPGPVVIYNIPTTTRVSVPLDVIDGLLAHPRLMGIKDSENNPVRHLELLRRFAGRDHFSIFIGVGALMAEGLKQGADGIIPSTGNLIPSDCQQQVEAARRRDWVAVDASAARQAEVAMVYQRDRTLAQGLAVLKGMLHLRGQCQPHVFPPLLPISSEELAGLGKEMARADLLPRANPTNCQP